MDYRNTIDHEVRRLVATSTNEKLVRYVERAVSESYTQGFTNGYRRRGDEKLRTLLWHHLSRSFRRTARSRF